ncbi:MAG: response regulator [Elusimicrobia bacterium]|nr:response regulator [Elusimicrobiota bacterium]
MKKVIIVDDDADMLDLMSEILKPNYDVRTACDGAAGLEVIRKERPDLVVLDLLMPRMHGFEVCKKMREDDSLKGTKVLISSSKSYVHDIKTAQSAGADAYIVKPFDLAAFVKQVDEMLGGAKPKLALTFWGTRGSIPAPGPATQRYGGNTPCTTMRLGSDLIIIDAGTGLRELGNALMKEFQQNPLKAHLFIGHTHWDHIQGFPFFTPAYLPQNKLQIYGVHGTTQSFEEVLKGQMNPTYFPVAMREMAARMDCVELSGPLRLGEIKVTYHYLNHPGITVGFRFETRDWTVCYVSDHEPYGKLNNMGGYSAKEDEAIARFVHGADLLISEAQYTDEEYKYKKTWGHSTFSDVIGLAVKAEVKKLALFHHDPLHTDEMMDRYVAECKDWVSRNGHSIDVFGAQEGMTLNL